MFLEYRYVDRLRVACFVNLLGLYDFLQCELVFSLFLAD